MEIAIDTNLLIRFLTKDDLTKVEKVSKLLKSGHMLILQDVILAEIIFVLQSVYTMDKVDIIEKVSAIIEYSAISCNKSLIKSALSIWELNNISFVDAYLSANAIYEDIKVASFDERVAKINSDRIFSL